MGAIQNIGKITKAMKMVASSKRRMDLIRLNQGKDFGVNVMPKVFDSDPYSKNTSKKIEPNKILLIPVTSDRGLCGGINSNLLRNVREMMTEQKKEYEILCIGEKGAAALQRPYPDIFRTAFTDLQAPLNFYNISTMVNHILENFKDWDNIWLVYNEYVNTISFNIKKMEIMSRKEFDARFNRLSVYDVDEPESDVSAPYYYELYVASQFNHAMLQNAACEQSARMNAMENASKNAGEILEKLTLQYNKARQARITMELVEIISGASAI